MNRDCPICSSKNTDLLYDRIDEIDHTHILRCVDCDLDFLETWNDIEHVKSLYEGDNYIFSHNISSSNEFLKLLMGAKVGCYFYKSSVDFLRE